jgi:hypothetical protein
MINIYINSAVILFQTGQFHKLLKSTHKLTFLFFVFVHIFAPIISTDQTLLFVAPYSHFAQLITKQKSFVK